MLGSIARKKLFLLLVVLCVGLLVVVGCDPALLELLDQTSFTLTMLVDGEGTVQPALGNHTYDDGTVVNLSATPASGWEFKEWVGEVANAENTATSVLMDKHQMVKAVFEEETIAEYTLTMQVEGQGTVTPALGTHTYDDGTVVNLSATPASGWLFVEWVGNVANNTSTNTTVLMNDNQTVTAVFYKEEWRFLYHGNHRRSANNGVGLTQPNILYAAMIIEKRPNDHFISGVSYYDYDDGCQVDVQVFGSSNTSNPQSLLWERGSSYYSSAQGWIEFDIPFNEKVEMTEYNYYWIIIKVNLPEGDLYPIGVDDGPSLTNGGKTKIHDGNWTTLYNVGIDANWLIECLVESTN